MTARANPQIVVDPHTGTVGNTSMIPLCDTAAQNRGLGPEIAQAMQDVVNNGQYILGPQVSRFEQEAASYCDCQHAIGVNSGTDALHLALRGLEIGPGDEVITTPFTFIATTEAMMMVGATPVFVDIDPLTYNIDVNQIEAAITSRTRAILPVHLYGQPCDMRTIMQIAATRHLHVIEDCAQALGARFEGQPVGTFGDAGCLSFFPSKNLGALGDGGMVITNRAELADRIEMLRRHGGRVKYHHTEPGLNSRLDEMQAAILRVKLPYLDRWNSLRRQAAYRYNRHFENLKSLTCPAERLFGELHTPVADAKTNREDQTAVYHQYTIRFGLNRDALSDLLRRSGVCSAVYYPIPLHLQEVHQDLGYRPGDLPNAERAARECLSLPIFPELSLEQQAVVVDALFRAETELGKAVVTSAA